MASEEQQQERSLIEKILTSALVIEGQREEQHLALYEAVVKAGMGIVNTGHDRLANGLHSWVIVVSNEQRDFFRQALAKLRAFQEGEQR